jgi:hypothetical protein
VKVAQVIQLPGLQRHIKLSGALEVTVDAAIADGCLDRVEIGRAQALQQRHLLWPPGQAVAHAVGQAGRAETTVTPGRGPPQPRALQNDDVAPRILFQRKHRGPQAGKTAADDRKVHVVVAAQCRARHRPADVVAPQRSGGRVLKRGFDLTCRHHGDLRGAGRTSGRHLDAAVADQRARPEQERCRDEHHRADDVICTGVPR